MEPSIHMAWLVKSQLQYLVLSDFPFLCILQAIAIEMVTQNFPSIPDGSEK